MSVLKDSEEKRENQEQDKEFEARVWDTERMTIHPASGELMRATLRQMMKDPSLSLDFKIKTRALLEKKVRREMCEKLSRRREQEQEAAIENERFALRLEPRFTNNGMRRSTARLGVESLEQREALSSTPLSSAYDTVRDDARRLYDEALVRIDADSNNVSVNMNGASETTGVVGSALRMQGATGYLSVPHEEANVFDTNRPFSIGAFFRIDDLNAAGDDPILTIFEKGNFAQNQSAVGLIIRPKVGATGCVDAYLQGGSNATRIYFRAPLDITYIDWNQIEMTYDGSGSVSGLRVYVNGIQLQASYSENNLRGNSFATTSPLQIRRGFNLDMGVQLPATVDLVRVNGAVLSPDAVQLNASLPRVEAPAQALVPAPEPAPTLTDEAALAAYVAARTALNQAKNEYLATVQPRMEVVSIDGANMTLNLTLPPGARGEVSLQYGTDIPFSLSEGSIDTRITVTLSPYVHGRYGEYDLNMMIGGQVADYIGVCWNPDAQKLGVMSFSEGHWLHLSNRPQALVEADAACAAARQTLIDRGIAVPDAPASSASTSQTTVEPVPAPAPEPSPSPTPAPAPVWESAPFDLVAMLGRYGIVGLRGGETVGGGSYVSIDNVDTSRYLRIDAVALDGESVELRDIQFINESGLHRLPEEYVEKISNATWIVKPDGPRHIVIGVASLSDQIHVGVRGGVTRAEVVPPAGLVIDLQALVTREPSAEGWVDWPATVPSANLHARAGDAVNTLFGIHNAGLSGGSLTVRVHIGSAGNASDPVLREFTTTIDPQSQKALSVNYVLPSDGAAITLIVILPDGTVLQQGKRVEMPEGNEVRPGWVDAYTWNRRVVAIAHASDSDGGAAALARYEAAWSGATTITAVVSELKSLGVSDADLATSGLLENPEMGVGGAEADSPRFWASMRARAQDESAANHYAILSQYALNSESKTEILLGTTTIRVDTEIGRIVAGIVPMLRNYRAAPWSLAQLCVRLEQVFGVNATQLYSLSKNATDERFMNGIIALFGQAGFDLANDIAGGMELQTQRIGSTLRVSANIGSFQNFQHIQANLINVGNGINVQENIVPISAGKFYVDIPLSAFVGLEGVGVKIIAWNAQGEVVAWNKTSAIAITDQELAQLSWTTEDLSVLPITDVLHNAERQILQQLVFPLQKDGVRWNNSELSSYHHGEGLYALDLNSPSDFGRMVLAPANGRMLRANLEKGTVIVEHRLPDGTLWTTTFHHLINILETQTGLVYEAPDEAAQRLRSMFSVDSAEYLAGMAEAARVRAEAQSAVDAYIQKHTIDAMTAFAAIGNEGLSEGSHLHMQVNIGSHAVNLFRWLNEQQNGIVTTANVSGHASYALQWDDGVGSLVNFSDHIVVQRMEINGEVVNVAYAWETGKSLTWQSAGVDSSGQEQFAWINIDPTSGVTSVWRQKNGIFGFVDLGTYKFENGLL